MLALRLLLPMLPKTFLLTLLFVLAFGVSSFVEPTYSLRSEKHFWMGVPWYGGKPSLPLLVVWEENEVYLRPTTNCQWVSVTVRGLGELSVESNTYEAACSTQLDIVIPLDYAGYSGDLVIDVKMMTNNELRVQSYSKGVGKDLKVSANAAKTVTDDEGNLYHELPAKNR